MSESGNQSENEKIHIEWLQSYRSIAVMLVFLAHVVALNSNYSKFTYGCGKIGVCFFMVLSGYLLLISSEKYKDKWVGRFYLKKTLRIYPDYIICILLCTVTGLFVLSDGGTDWSTVLKNVLLIKGNFHLWYVPVIMKFYLVAPLIILINKRNLPKVVKISVFCVLLVAMSLIFRFMNIPENSSELKWYMNVFLLGVLMYYIPKSETPAESIWGDVAVILSGIVIFLFTPLMRYLIFGIEPSKFLTNKLIFVGFLWGIIIQGTMHGKYIKKLLEMVKPLKWMGTISYQFYLIHWPVIYFLRRHLTVSFAAFVLISFAISVGCSVICYFFTNILIKWMKNSRNE